MSEDIFEELDRRMDSGNTAAGLDFLIERFRAMNETRLFFEAKLMKTRLELGLPLIQTDSFAEFPQHVRAAYDAGMVEAARETGHLALNQGDIVQAWPYFRAIGERDPIAAAIEGDHADESADQIINIAFREGVHPKKGLELILKHHGMCQAITAFGMYAVENGRADCIGLLVRSLHAELMGRMGRVIEQQEGKLPEGETIAQWCADRDWLFGEYDYYVDTSHLTSLLPYSVEVNDPGTLGLLHDLCQYGQRLSPMFQSKGQPPFEEPFRDYDHYILALLGDDVEARIAHFRKKATESDPDEVGTAPAQALVNLAVRLGRFEDALQASLEFLADENASDLTCPSTLQLCNMAGDRDRLKLLARTRGDLLSYVAATQANIKRAASLQTTSN
jgi:hypothetical protein